jgi:diaminohydroxyphosphoribosylaminopyrimidine deaminase/5-amino-6-(5-phosphoribosylamino)uracil reductase
MVGAGTARADDPALTVRGFGDVPQPVRIVVSRMLDVPLLSQLAQTAKEVPVWICHGTSARSELVDAWQSIEARLFPCQLKNGRLDPASVLQALGGAGLTRVFCEGGGQLAASLLSADLVDELHVFHAGLALGAEGYPGLGALGIERLAEAPRFELVDVAVDGGDIHHIWRRGGVR